MTSCIHTRLIDHAVRHCAAAGLAALLYLAGGALPAAAQSPVKLADQPIFGTADVPGNLALTLSVEFPDGHQRGQPRQLRRRQHLLGLFRSGEVLHLHLQLRPTPSSSYFQPANFATGTYFHKCSGQWSGNFMNWASMQTIDPFRWALSGGYRSVDTVSQTILEKAYGSAQGSAGGNFKLLEALCKDRRIRCRVR